MKRIIAMLLAIVMLVGNVPVQAFATEGQTEESACVTPDCTYAAGHEGNCSNYVAPEEPDLTPAACATTGCEYEAGHEGHCSNYVEPAADAAVYVTVSDRGELGMAYEEVTVSDINKDGRLSVDEALYAAHTVYGKGYASENGTVTKLWDVETTNVSFFVNHNPISNDVSTGSIRDGDYLVASVDQDAVNDYDKYSCFAVMERSVKAGEAFTLNLTDDAGNDLAGMEIGLWDGNGSTAMTGLTTDVNGQVTMTLDQEGVYCVTAKGSVVETSVNINTMEMTTFEAPILAPVCVVTVAGTAVQEPVAVYTQRAAEEGSAPVMYASANSDVAAVAENSTELSVSGGTITLAAGSVVGSTTLTKMEVYTQGDFAAVSIASAVQNGNTIDIILADTTNPAAALQVGISCTGGVVNQSGNQCTLNAGQGTMVVLLTAYPGYGSPQPTGTATYTINFSIPMGEAVTITPPTGEGFTFTGNDSAYKDQAYTFSVKVAEGYDDTSMVVKVNGEAVTGDNGSYTVSSVSGDLVITVEGIVKKEQCSVTLTSGNGYTITSTDIPYKGEDYTFTVAADAVNYKSDTLKVLLDDETELNGENGTYTIPSLAQDHVVTVTIDKKAEYTVIKNTMDGVTITGADTVLETDPYTFSVSVDNAHDASEMKVMVNGEVVNLTDNSYTIDSVSDNITITVTDVTKKDIYTVTLTEGEGYTISGQTTSYAGEPYTFTVTVDDAIYKAGEIVVKVNEQEVTLTDGKYTIEALSGDTTVTVDNVVERTLFTVTKPEVEGVTFTGADSVREGKSYTFSISVDSAYDGTAMVVTVNDQSVSLIDGSYTIESAAENIVIAVTDVVKKEVCSIILPTGKGYIVSGAQTAYKGDSYTFTVTVAAGYVGTNLVVTVNGETVTGTNGSYTITVVDNTTIEVTGVEPAPLPDTELTVTDNVIDISDKTVYSLASSIYAKAINIQISGVTVKKAYEDGTTVYILLPSDTADDARLQVTFGTSLGRCTMEGTTGSLTLADGEGMLSMTLTGKYGTRKGTATYTLIFIREVPSTEPPVCVKTTDVAELYKNTTLELNLESYFTDADTYYLVEGENRTPVEDGQFSLTPTEAGTLTLVFTAANEAGECPQQVTVTVTVKEITGGTWIGHNTSNGSVDYVVFTDASGAQIDGLEASYAANKITVVLPKSYDPSGNITATFTRTANTSDIPFLTANNAFNKAYNQRTDIYTNTLSGGTATRTVYLYNNKPGATSNNPTIWTITYSIKNELPVLAEDIAATAEATITAGQNYTLDLTKLFTDADGDSLSYLVSINGAAAVAAEDAYSYTTNDAGTYTLVFTANDGKGTSTASHTVTLTVENSTETNSMTVSLPEGLDPKFYASTGFGTDGIDILGDALTVNKGENGYTVSYPANIETISIREETWGGMVFPAEADTTVTLRQVQMDVEDYDGNSAESTNTVTYDGHTAVHGTNGWLLVTGKEYTFQAVPKDASLAAVSMAEAVQPGESIHIVKAVLGISNPIAITVPTGATARLYNYDTGKYYKASELEAKIVKDNGDGTTTYSFVGDTKANGVCFIYQVSKPGKITKAGYLGWGKQTLTVTFNDSDKADTWRLDDYSGEGQANSSITEDSVVLNINSRNHLYMSVGETKTLKAYRTWEIIKISYQNYIITPEFNYTILSGDNVVRLEDKDSNSAGEGDWKTLTAIGEGIAVIEVTYKAIEVAGGSYDGAYGATDPARTGLVVVQVGGNYDSSVNFGIDCFTSRGSAGSQNISYNPNAKREWDAEFDTLYFTGTNGQLKLTPTAGSAVTEVAVSHNKGGSWTALTGVDGVYTAPIVSGNNILRITTAAGVSYQVVRGDRIAVQIQEQAGDADGKMEPGETVRVTLKGLHMPIPKMAGNYNPGYYGNTDGYSSAHLNYTFDGNAVYGPGTQYNFITTANYVDVVIPEDTTKNTLTLTDGYIGVGVMGLTAFDQGGDSHRNIPDNGCNTRGSQSTWHTRSILPEITVAVEGLPVAVTGVKLDQTELTLEVGQTQTLKATVEPGDADNKAVTWSSDNAAVATAKDGVVTAVGEGTAIITVTTEDGTKTATCTVTVEAVPAKTAEVYFSVSHDDQFLETEKGVMAMQKLTVPYFDLNQYDLGAFSLPETHADYGKPTMLHLYLYATEIFQYGIAPEEAGEGYLKDQIGSDLFAVSGGPGSICIDKFWNMDMNLNYYHNYQFPADESGTGITADRVILSDGDIVTIGHFTSWSFFGDSTSIFNYLTIGKDTVVSTAAQNEILSLQVYRAGVDLGGGGSNTPVAAIRDIYYIQADAVASGNVTTWTKLGTTDATGRLNADISDLPVGRYLLAVAGQKGVEYPNDIVSTPGGILLNVTPNTLAPAVQAVISKIKAIGTVTLEKEAAITAAREAYEALNEAEKSAVTNLATLEAAEEALKQLQQEKADQEEAKKVADLIDAIGDVTLDSEEAIQTARDAYEALTETQKTFVENLQTLTTAETVLATLKAAQADKEEAKKVDDLIESIGEVTEDSESDIEAAREAYDALTDAQKVYVTNYDALVAAEEALRLLKLSNADIARIYQSTGDFLAGREAPGVGTMDGEWRVIGLARAGRSVPDAYYESVVEYVEKNIKANGRLHENKSSDNSRIVLALTAIGKDVTDVGGYDLLSGLNEMKYIQKQGLNGTIWALLAFDSHDYPIPEGDVTREMLIQVILDAQNPDGGWALAGTTSDPDMTGMALTALAPYYGSDAKVQSAVEKALTWLSDVQSTVDGTFSSVTEGTTCESVAQVITALTALGIDPETDSRFVKKGVSALDALASFYMEGGGFRHGTTGERNLMATEQGYYALVSYYRLLQKKNDLYDMSDVTIETSAANQAAADAVADLINAIGEVDLTKEDEIQAARAAYDALTVMQKNLVTNYATLTAAETALAELKQTDPDKEAADAVKAMIDAIGTVDLSKEGKITDARAAYNRLSELQKDLVGADYLAKLEAAETALEQKKQEKADTDAVNNVIAKINRIPTDRNINKSDETVIQDARKAYDALRNDTLRERVTNRQKLFNAETALNLLKSTISVTFTLMGCYKHGANETTTHTLVGGNLQTWIPAKTYTVQPGSTVKDLFEKALREAGLTWQNPSGNYVESITRNGVAIGEFTNGQNSGWMYTLNGKHSSLGVAQQTLVSGDKVVFHYSDDYTKEDGSNSTTGTTTGTTTTSTIFSTVTSTTVTAQTAEAVDRLIEDIGEEITLDSETKILAARAAYDKLTEEQKQLVKNYDALVAAEAKLAELKGTSAENVYMETGDYIQSLGTPGVGTIGGEWMVIGLARSGRGVPNGYYDHVLHYVRENIDTEERLHSAKSSDNSRMILALTAIGEDVSNVDGHDLLKGLSSMEYIQKQGINGPIWALLAFDSGNYPVPAGDVSREKLIQVILDAQLSDGGWALSGERSDPDMTGMAIQALAPYLQSRMDVEKAVEAAIWTLSEMQNDNGSFTSIDGPNCESIAQVIVALASLDIDADTDARFVKNGISALDALLTYYIPGGGFRHVLTGNLDGMATEQAFYALVAYNRMLQNQNFLYDMTDIIDAGGDVMVEEITEPTEMPTEPAAQEENEDNGNDVMVWTGVMTVCAAAIAILLLNKKKLFGKFL